MAKIMIEQAMKAMLTGTTFVCTNEPRFDHTLPIIFHCNGKDPELAITPDVLEEQYMVFDYKQVAGVIVTVTGSAENLYEVIKAVQFWTEYDVPVLVLFVPSDERPEPHEYGMIMGIPADDAYVVADNKWYPSARLIAEVNEYFADDRLVSINDPMAIERFVQTFCARRSA